MTARYHEKYSRYDKMKQKTRRLGSRAAGIVALMMLTACGAPVEAPPAETDADTIMTETTALSGTTAQTETSVLVTEQTEETTEATATEATQTEPVEYDYVHGDEGYFCLLENGVEFEFIRQLSGTCWICAASCAMSTNYSMDSGKSIVFDQKELVDIIYDDDKEEGIFLKEGIDKDMFGGFARIVINELSRGFGDGLVLDDAIVADGWSPDEIKEGIKKYGALYIGIPDTDRTKMRYFGKYFTMNFPDAKEEDFDHSIAVLGWDDNFPKEYFKEQASQDGAWITYNSNFPKDYYYVSYDTPFEKLYDPPTFLSVSDKYTKILSYDCGMGLTDPVITGDVTTTANVFKGEGTLSAVGTFSCADDEDITIKLLTPDLSECLYSEDHHIDYMGYHVIEFTEPQAVDEYAISISYKRGAPVEGDHSEIEDGMLIFDPVCESGRSFILIDGEWHDMSEEATAKLCGFVTNNACIKALYTEGYTE